MNFNKLDELINQTQLDIAKAVEAVTKPTHSRAQEQPATRQRDVWSGSQLDDLKIGGVVLDGETSAIMKSAPTPLVFADIDQSLSTLSNISKADESKVVISTGFNSLESAGRSHRAMPLMRGITF